jgi:hypothetical protein
MVETGVKYIVSPYTIDPKDLEAVEVIRHTRADGTRTYKPRQGKQVPPPPPAPMTKKLYGVEIKQVAGLGQQDPDSQSFWKMILGELPVGFGCDVPKQRLSGAQKAVQKYNRESKKIWKETRQFVFEKNIDTEGNKGPGIGRVGRVK